MKKADIAKEMSGILAVFPDSGIAWHLDNDLLFIFFKRGSFTSNYRKIKCITADENGIRVLLKTNVKFEWRRLTDQLWCVQYS